MEASHPVTGALSRNIAGPKKVLKSVAQCFENAIDRCLNARPISAWPHSDYGFTLPVAASVSLDPENSRETAEVPVAKSVAPNPPIAFWATRRPFPVEFLAVSQ
jgi:hypothetical protein